MCNYALSQGREKRKRKGKGHSIMEEKYLYLPYTSIGWFMEKLKDSRYVHHTNTSDFIRVPHISPKTMPSAQVFVLRSTNTTES